MLVSSSSRFQNFHSAIYEWGQKVHEAIIFSTIQQGKRISPLQHHSGLPSKLTDLPAFEESSCDGPHFLWRCHSFPWLFTKRREENKNEILEAAFSTMTANPGELWNTELSLWGNPAIPSTYAMY